jgi:hypothetical protein
LLYSDFPKQWCLEGTGILAHVSATTTLTIVISKNLFQSTTYFARTNHMNSSPASARRVPAPHRRTQFKPKPSSYSHINIQPATQDDAKDLESDNAAVEYFVRHKSLQVEIEEGLAFARKLARPSSKSPERPRTFAEAAMSTRRQGRRNSAMDGSSGATLSGPMSLESLGPFKYTFKKKKKISKWSPLDLSAADSASEVGSISASDVGSSRAASPNPQSSILSREFDNTISTSNTTTQSSTTSRNFDNPIPNTTPGKSKAIQETDLDFQTDADPTPTQPRFEPFCHTPIENEFDCGNSLDFIDCNASDSQSTKDRTEAAMAAMAHAFGGKKAGEDAFDALEWDPDLPVRTSAEQFNSHSGRFHEF